jgi:hypothetical protein
LIILSARKKDNLKNKGLCQKQGELFTSEIAEV